MFWRKQNTSSVPAFYLLNTLERWHALFVETAEHVSVHSFDAFKLLRGAESLTESLEVVEIYPWMRRVDFVDGSLVGIQLISDRMRDVLTDNSVTGWHTYEVDVRRLSGKSIRGYHGLVITGRAGPIEWNRRVPVWSKPYFRGGPPVRHLRGLPLSMEEWDGSDFFLENGKSIHMFISPRLRAILRTARLSNIMIEEPDEFEHIYVEEIDGTAFEWPERS